MRQPRPHIDASILRFVYIQNFLENHRDPSHGSFIEQFFFSLVTCYNKQQPGPGV